MEGVAEFVRLAIGDTTKLLERFLDALEREGLAYCLIDGHALNAYVEPLFSRDITFALAPADFDRAVSLLRDQERTGGSALHHDRDRCGRRRARGTPRHSRPSDDGCDDR